MRAEKLRTRTPKPRSQRKTYHYSNFIGKPLQLLHPNVFSGIISLKRCTFQLKIEAVVCGTVGNDAMAAKNSAQGQVTGVLVSHCLRVKLSTTLSIILGVSSSKLSTVNLRQ
jgi:hypothetical protein